jgi:hypothetical protein
MEHPGEKYSMIQECTDKYVMEEKTDGIRITIDIPARFKWLWMTKLSDLETDDKEISEYPGGNQT